LRRALGLSSTGSLKNMEITSFLHTPSKRRKKRSGGNNNYTRQELKNCCEKYQSSNNSTVCLKSKRG